MSFEFPKLLLQTPGTAGLNVSVRELYAGQYASPMIREHCALPLGHHVKATVSAM